MNITSSLLYLLLLYAVLDKDNKLSLTTGLIIAFIILLINCYLNNRCCCGNNNLNGNTTTTTTTTNTGSSFLTRLTVSRFNGSLYVKKIPLGESGIFVTSTVR